MILNRQKEIIMGRIVVHGVTGEVYLELQASSIGPQMVRLTVHNDESSDVCLTSEQASELAEQLANFSAVVSALDAQR